MHGNTSPSPPRPHGTAINQNKPTPNDPKPNPSDHNHEEPAAAGGANLGEPMARREQGVTPASPDMRFVDDTESGIYSIPDPASSHKQINLPGFLPPRLMASCNRQTFHLL